ncbi:MAG: EAL domain-containing protein [Burkholderiaceae bacterium]
MSALFPAGASAAPDSMRGRFTILVVDDDAMVRLMAKAALVEAGYDVAEAESAEAGLARFERAPADLVLLDLLLPGMDGYEACRRLRSHPAGQHIPIIVMTGLGDRQSIHKAYECGATDFITKPMVWDLLPYRVRYALRSSQALHHSVRNQALLSSSQRIANMGSWEWLVARDCLSYSEELERIHGTAPGMAQGDARARLLSMVHAGDRELVEAALARTLRDGEPYSMEFRIVRSDGHVRHLFEQTDVERDSAGAVFAVRGIRHDITQRTEAARRIHCLAYVDALTGLPNGTLFRDMVQQWLLYAARRELRCAVAMINLERFELINDTLGELISNQVLQAVSQKLRDCVRIEDPKGLIDAATSQEPLARLGTGEFSIFLADIGTPEQALRVVRRIAETLAERIVVDGHELTLGASIGIAIAPDDGDDGDTLLRNAGTAMHAARREGRSQVRLYNQTMGQVMRRRHTLEIELGKALECGELRVFYQAKVDARSRRAVGAEALLRWQHPQRGLVSPAEFIPVAEESGLIVPITDFVVSTVCGQLAQWQHGAIQAVPVSVNLDARTLQDEGLVERIRSALECAGIHHSLLEFEVTETSLMKDLDSAARVLRDLKSLGFKLAIDDFGTGHSSLTYLKRFPFDILKIDRGFVKDLPHDKNDAALTSAIIAMGRSLNLELVAEGVEKTEQADFLTQLGCHLVQGFLFSRPVPAEQFTELLRGATLGPAAAEPALGAWCA